MRAVSKNLEAQFSATVAESGAAIECNLYKSDYLLSIAEDLINNKRLSKMAREQATKEYKAKLGPYAQAMLDLTMSKPRAK